MHSRAEFTPGGAVTASRRRNFPRSGGNFPLGFPDRATSMPPVPTHKDIADLQFIEARSRLLDLAAYLDRVQRADGPDDYRSAALRAALPLLLQPGPGRAKAVLEALSDHSFEPIPHATTQGAFGAPLPPARP